MPQLPSAALDAWEARVGPAVLTTVSPQGVPNTVYVMSIRLDAERFVVADVHFHKTRANIAAGSPGALLYIDGENNAFQIKGRLESHSGGPVVDAIKQWLNPDYALHAGVTLSIDEVYRGAEKLT